ncbi:MAG: hypothetical protein ACYC3A_09810 [Halothiobacillus sp.]
MNARHLAVIVLTGVSMEFGLNTASAFDIPTPQNQPKALNTTPFGTQKDFGPVMPLAPITELDSRIGAGHLPEGVDVRSEIRQPPNGFLLRAPVLVILTITDKNKRIASLTLHRPYGDSVEARRIGITQRLESVDGRMANVSVYQFAVTPLSAGELTLKFAEMTFREVGDASTQYAFIPVARTLGVRPLPGFWPEYLPVTPTLSISEKPLPKLAAGQPVDWRLQITGRGLTEHALHLMLDEQLMGSAALGIGKVEIRLSPTAPIPTDDALAQTFDIRIPILPDPQDQNATEGSLPALRLAYINSDSPLPDSFLPGQQLSQANLAAQTVHWPTPPRARAAQILKTWWWRGLLLAALAYGAGFVLREGWIRLNRRRRHRAAQAELALCANPEACLQALRRITGEATIGGIIKRAPNPRLMAALHELDAACYQNQSVIPAHWVDTRAELVRWLPRVFFEAKK